MGFFLPVPPKLGGATEKIWHRLAEEFAVRGHQVTIISRRWQNWPQRESIGNLSHLRLPGADHRASLAKNLLLDFLWSMRVWRAQPASDITVSHPISLPILLGITRRRAGRIVVVPGRMPRGQYRGYRSVDAVLSTSSVVGDRIGKENTALISKTFVRGNPIDWRQLSQPRPPSGILTLGFIGRLHREKGLELLASAIELLASRRSHPPFRVLLCGPVDIAGGGSGHEYGRALQHRLESALGRERVELLAPVFEPSALADIYRRIDIFCYPSTASGETFGVAVAEAMASGATVVVSDLACFRDYVSPGVNAIVFDHAAPDAASRLAEALDLTIADPALRARLSAQGAAAVRRFDYAVFAETLLNDFRALHAAPLA